LGIVFNPGHPHPLLRLPSREVPVRLASLRRESIYLAILILLPLVIAAGPAGSALAGTPAAKYIGADTYSSPTWAQADNPGSKYYIGPLQSEKFFYNYNASNNALPNSDSATTYEYGVPGCGAMSGGSYVYPTSMLCIVVWDYAASTDGSDLQNFLESTLNDPHQIVMTFCNEAEGNVSKGKCMCDPTGTVKPCDTSTAFINQFEIESSKIATFEKNHNKSNVQVAEISTASWYRRNSGCNFIVPSNYVDHYLVDVYEGNGTPISSPEKLNQDQGWNNWVTCTTGAGISRGIAEFAINCGNEAVNEQAVAQSYTEDDTYLKNNFPSLYVWNLWDTAPGCDIESVDEPDSVAAWQNIAAGN
jgi:hypothetical protein